MAITAREYMELRQPREVETSLGLPFVIKPLVLSEMLKSGAYPNCLQQIVMEGNSGNIEKKIQEDPVQYLEMIDAVCCNGVTSPRIVAEVNAASEEENALWIGNIDQDTKNDLFMQIMEISMGAGKDLKNFRAKPGSGDGGKDSKAVGADPKPDSGNSK